MTPVQQLEAWLKTAERRLRIAASARGAALVAGSALALTILLVLAMNTAAFSEASVAAARVVLFGAVSAALVFGLLVPVLHLGRRRAAERAEHRVPELEQRLVTAVERIHARDPFTELLAADALEKIETSGAPPVVPARAIGAFGAAAACAGAVLVWLIVAGPGFLGYGAALLWAGPSKPVQPYYEILVQPGNRTVRRKTDQLVTARLAGFTSDRVKLVARYRGAGRWEPAQMQPKGAGYEFLFAGLPDTVDYYVEAGGIRSTEYRLKVKDLPGVKRIRVTYQYPGWTGLKPTVEDPGGDLRAVEGTQAEVTVQFDRAADQPALVLDDGRRIPLESGTARVPIAKDGSYYVAAIDGGEAVRLSEDYFIEARPDDPPTVRITQPGRDAKVSPIEEVSVAVAADDDFGLRDLALHYSVNGGPEKTLELGGAGRRSAEANAILYLEDGNLVPGDIVAMYATARDARSTTKTDIYFLQAEPFERNYSQSQQSGEMEGGGEQDRPISERQKEIIAATWNQLRGTARGQDNARFLSGVQSKLRDQARSLARRMQSRELTANPEFQQFGHEMEQAAGGMDQAASKLGAAAWQPALPPEQKALQHLLRAEAIFRDIRVSMRRNGQGGRGGGSGRDLESLFDLELDTEKNQYETGQQAQAEQRDRDLDEAFQKLEELARRQQQLAEQQARQQMPQQRWQQEMLRREAEQLRRRMEEMARSSSGSQPGQQQSSQEQGRQQAQSSTGSSGSRQVNEAMRGLERAMDEMRRAMSASPDSPEARRAAEQLQQAAERLRSARREQAGTQVRDLARRAGELSREQQDYVNRLRQTFGDGTQGRVPRLNRSDAGAGDQLAGERGRMLGEADQLARDLQTQSRNLAGSNPATASKLRDALGEMEKDEVRARMKYHTELLRRGYGAYTILREAPITRALNNLVDRLRDAEAAAEREARKSDQSAGEQEIERALAEVEQLRRGFEGRGEQRGGSPEYGGAWQRGIMHLRSSLRNYPELARKIESVNARDLPARLAQIELELRRKLGDANDARAGVPDPAPPEYADAVVEYFRRLSEKK